MHLSCLHRFQDFHIKSDRNPQEKEAPETYTVIRDIIHREFIVYGINPDTCISRAFQINQDTSKIFSKLVKFDGLVRYLSSVW